jgi:hypothetical protein
LRRNFRACDWSVNLQGRCERFFQRRQSALGEVKLATAHADFLDSAKIRAIRGQFRFATKNE